MSSEEGVKAVLPARNVREYFRELLAASRQNQGVRLEDATEFYLVELLARFLDAEHLTTVGEEGEALALMLARAMEQTTAERVGTLRKLGDVSLFVSGFFSDSLSSGLVNVDYYIAMGGRAYASVHQIVRVEVYAELSDQFPSIVNLFGEVAERSSMKSERGLLRLYETWLRTGSSRLARLLVERGMPGVFISKKTLPS